jgi:hypothetical protein
VTGPTGLEYSRRFGDQLARLNEEIYRAELAGNVSARVALLRERAQVWQQLAQTLSATGRDDVGARLAAQRDLVKANRLSTGGLW